MKMFNLYRGGGGDFKHLASWVTDKSGYFSYINVCSSEYAHICETGKRLSEMIGQKPTHNSQTPQSKTSFSDVFSSRNF